MSRERQNTCLPSGEKLIHDALAVSDQQRERVQPKASADSEAPHPIGNVNDSVLDLDARRTLQKDRRIEVLAHHVVHLARKKTRRGNGYDERRLIKPLINMAKIPNMISARLPLAAHRSGRTSVLPQREAAIRSGLLTLAAC